MRSEATFAAVALLVVASCRSRPPETRIVVVTATPAPAAFVVPAEPTVTPIIETAEFSFPIVEPTESLPPPATPAPIEESVFEPRREPTPASLHERMERCLFFVAEKDLRAVSSDMYRSIYARVKARNDCDTSLPGEQSWVEVRVIAAVGGQGVGQEYARFQGPIPARGTAETFVRITAEGIEPTQFYRFEVSLWPDAGTGRSPDWVREP
jgi:hypothetical protein